MHPAALRDARVDMVEATEDRHRTDRPRTTRQRLGRRRRERLAAALVRPRLVAVRDIRAPHAGAVARAEDEEVIAARAARAAQEARAHRMRPRRARGCAPDRDAARLRHPREARPARAVVVAAALARALVERGALSS